MIKVYEKWLAGMAKVQYRRKIKNEESKKQQEAVESINESKGGPLVYVCRKMGDFQNEAVGSPSCLVRLANRLA
jgi:hypothetical protein